MSLPVPAPLLSLAPRDSRQTLFHRLASLLSQLQRQPWSMIGSRIARCEHSQSESARFVHRVSTGHYPIL